MKRSVNKAVTKKNRSENTGRRRGIRILKAMLTIFLIFVMVVLLCAAVIISKAPSIDSADVQPEGYYTTVLDDEGEVMTHLVGTEANRVYVELEEIPENLQNAFIAIEDARFYQHHGVDLRGIARAIVKGVTKGKLKEGASTITQQLLKNNVFTEWTSEDTMTDKIVRKVQEQYLAIRLERIQSKEWILENYLNTINLGSGTWGVQAASKRYFDKDVSELTISECAVLAGITKSPTAYNPILHPEKSQERQKLVLKNMLEQGYISGEEYDEALADPVYERIETAHTENESDIFSYFEDSLITQIVNDMMEQLGYSEEKAWDTIYRGGLTIYATQDSAIQNICEEEVNSDSLYSGDQQVSVVIMDESDGSVKAIVGGRGTKTGSLTYNRATDSVRQPGSTFKVIGAYAAALEDRTATLGTAVNDEPYAYSNGTAIGNAYTAYKGMITIREAIECSSNVVALKTFQQVGMDKTMTCAAALGIDTLTDADRVEALAIGGTNGGVTNLEMTAAYTAIGAQGVYRTPYYYYKVVDHDGNVLLQHQDDSRQVIRQSTAYLLTSAMESVMTAGTGTSANFYGMSLAGKSGTTNDCRDLWFIGYSPYYSLGVWGGFDSNDAQTDTKYVKVLWKNIMSRVHENYLYKEFEKPDSVTEIYICSKCGKRAVEGLCEDTLQGNMAYTEYYESGTEPSAYCDCHVAVSICKSSNKPVNSYCPEDEISQSVYLVSGTANTADASFVYTGSDGDTCDVHKSLWDQFWDHFGNGDEDTEGGDGENSYGNNYGDSYGNSQGDSNWGNGDSQNGGAWGDSWGDDNSQTNEGWNEHDNQGDDGNQGGWFQDFIHDVFQ